jgi:hypothetical protein
MAGPRTLFLVYLVLILAGLALSILIGASHR